MRLQNVVIELSPSRLDVALVAGGRIVRSHGAALKSADWLQTWQEGLKPLVEPLESALRALGVEKASATLVHSSPESAAELYSSPAKGKRALDAARLALSDAVSYPLAKHPIDVECVGRDVAGEPRQTHVIGAADHTSSAEKMVSWLEGAGLVVARLVPADAGLLASLVRRVLDSKGEQVFAVAHIGEHGSALAAGRAGRLDFVRRLDIGLELIVVALTSPITPRGADHETISLSRDEARRLLVDIGIPRHDQVIDERRRLTGGDILPLVQPVLQRCVVEMRQPMRFGLSDEDRAKVSLHVVGPGASVPGLGRILASQLEIPLENERASATEQRASAAHILNLFEPCSEAGDLRLSLGLGAMKLNLMPESAAKRAAISAARRGLWIGAGAAGLVLAGEAAVTMSAIDSVRERREKVAPVAAEVRDAAERLMAARELSVEVAAAERRIADRMGLRTSWPVLMGEFSRLTPESIRMTGISLGVGADGPTASMRGYVMLAADGDARSAVTDYVSRLSSCPLVGHVAIGATQRSQIDGRPAQRFDLALTLVGVKFGAAGEIEP